MPTVLDSAGKPIDLPAEQVADKWRAGEVNLVAGQKYAVRSPLGKVFLVPSESLHTALGNGGQVISDADLAEYKEQKEYGGAKGAIIAGASGFAEQATLGLAPNLYSESAKQAVEASERQHPIVHGAGEVGGALGLSAVLPGGGVAGLVERGGAALLEGAGESTLARISARALLHSAKEAAAGLQFGTAQAISDDAFADHKLTAAQMLSTIGANALWGGALGAGLGAAGAVLPRGAAGKFAEASGAKTAVERAMEGGADDASLGNVAAKAIGADTPAEGLGAQVRRWYSKVAAAASGGDEKAIENFVGKDGYQNRQLLAEADRTRDEASRAIRERIDTVLEASRAVQEEGMRPLKRGYIRKAMEGVDASEAAQSARDMADHTITKLDEMLKAPEDYGGTAALRRAMTVTEGISKKLDAAIQSGDVGEQFGLVDDMKKAVGKYAKGASRLSPAAATDELISLQNRARASGLQEIYEHLRGGLENEDVWKKAATDQKQINRAWTTQIDASDRFHRALTTEIGRDPNNPWATIRGVDPAKADSYVRNLQNPAQDLTHQSVTDYVRSTKTLADTMAEAYDLPPPKAAEVRRLGKAADDFHETLQTTSKTLQLVNQFEKLRQTASGEGSMWGAAIGAMTGGVGGGALGMALGRVRDVFTRPADAIMQVARVEQMLRDSDLRIVKAFRGMTGAGAKAAPKSTPIDAFSRKAGQVRALTTNPDLLQERVAANIGPMRRTAPKLSSALTMASLSGLAFLRDKLPPAAPPDPLDPTRKPREPPKGLQAQWLRYYDAVTDPVVLADQVRAGRVTPEAIEVLHLPAYKPLHDRMRQLAGEEFATGRMKDLTSQQRIGIGLALDLPIPELSPAYIASSQSAFAPPAHSPTPPGAPAGQPRKGKPVDFVKRAAPPQTPADRVELGAST